MSSSKKRAYTSLCDVISDAFKAPNVETIIYRPRKSHPAGKSNGAGVEKLIESVRVPVSLSVGR